MTINKHCTVEPKCPCVLDLEVELAEIKKAYEAEQKAWGIAEVARRKAETVVSMNDIESLEKARDFWKEQHRICHANATELEREVVRLRAEIAGLRADGVLRR